MEWYIIGLFRALEKERQKSWWFCQKAL